MIVDVCLTQIKAVGLDAALFTWEFFVCRPNDPLSQSRHREYRAVDAIAASKTPGDANSTPAISCKVVT
jgi:hypothetical protein